MTYKRVILRIPVTLSFEALTPEQQAAIASVFGQFAMPMPGTISNNGYKLCDAVTAENFQPERMALYNFNWPLVGMWQDDGTTLVPFDETTFMQHLPAPEQGDKVLHEPHKWAGWPDCFG